MEVAETPAMVTNHAEYVPLLDKSIKGINHALESSSCPSLGWILLEARSSYANAVDNLEKLAAWISSLLVIF